MEHYPDAVDCSPQREPLPDTADIDAFFDPDPQRRHKQNLHKLQVELDKAVKQLKETIDDLVNFDKADEDKLQLYAENYLELLISIKNFIGACRQSATELDVPTQPASSAEAISSEYRFWLDATGINQRAALMHARSWLALTNDQFETSLQSGNFAATGLDGYEVLDLCIEVVPPITLRRLLDKVEQGLSDQTLAQAIRNRLQAQLQRTTQPAHH